MTITGIFPNKMIFQTSFKHRGCSAHNKKVFKRFKRKKKKGKLVTQNPTLNVVPRNDPMI